ncbi:uncharacterized protein LOC106710469 [Papilio machaon]|uniref:uncharacterized protein LOC106710469 n=1 Tax=Papilio machaon TaxID=76193 RepID=UPI001E665F3D|nr:uncharacterized protein LOC106710469 [Papilio machaon]
MQRKCYFACEFNGPLHSFPAPSYPHEDRFNKWKSVLGEDLKNKDNNYIHKNVRLCRRHFEGQFHTSGNRLTANSFPTLNLFVNDGSIPVTGLEHQTVPDVISVQIQKDTSSFSRGTKKVFAKKALQAKEKWKNLRSVFVRNLKPQPKGSKKKKYYLTDAMQFVKPYIKIAGTPSSLPDPDEQGDEYNEPQDPLSPASSPSRSSTPLSDSTRRSSSDFSNQNYRRKKKKISETDELLNEFMKSKNTKKDDDEKPTINNANKMFLLSLLPDLNCMTPTQVRIFKRQVIDLMDNILTEPPNSSTLTLTLKSEHIPSTSNASSSQITRLEEW